MIQVGTALSAKMQPNARNTVSQYAACSQLQKKTRAETKKQIAVPHEIP